MGYSTQPTVRGTGADVQDRGAGSPSTDAPGLLRPSSAEARDGRVGTTPGPATETMRSLASYPIPEIRIFAPPGISDFSGAPVEVTASALASSTSRSSS